MSSTFARTAFGALAAALAAGLAAAPARPALAVACPSSTADAYSIAASALTGPGGTDVTLRVTAAAGCDAVAQLKKVQLKTRTAAGAADRVVNLTDVGADGGVAVVPLSRVERGRAIEADVLVQTGTPPRTYALRDTTTSRLRPDLVVSDVRVAPQTLATRPVDVSVEIAERNGDTGATAELALSSGIGPLATPTTVTVPPGGKASVTFPAVALAEPVRVEVVSAVTGADPAETDDGNNSGSAFVEVTRNELAPSRVLVQSLGGYGFQFNHHVYAPVTSPPADSLPGFEAKVKALEPQLVRVFYSENWEENRDGNHPAPEYQLNLEAFRKAVALANDSGATVVIDYQSVGYAKTHAVASMSQFAGVVDDLVRTRGLTNVRWATIGNEPNSTNLTLAQYEALYRAFDAALRTRNLRDRIGLIGGDLVQNTEGTAGGHRAWFDYMVGHMNDVIDAWSEHIYWQYFVPRRMEERLKDVAYLVHQELPEAARKPTLIMEYGVRGYDTCGGKPQAKYTYYPDADCTEIRTMPLAAFHKLWFGILAAQLGLDGAANWDAYWGVYDNTRNAGHFWAIGPASEGWPLTPSYHALRLLLLTTERGWQVLGVDPTTPDDEAAPVAWQGTEKWRWDGAEQELTAFSGPDGQLTVVGLDTRGGQLVAPTDELSSYSIGNLTPGATFTLAVWNADGDGENVVAGTLVANGSGVVRFEVPLQAAFALTTVPVS